MQKYLIIEQLYRDKDINKAISKMQPVELQDDLRQEIFLVLCEQTDEKVLMMHEKGFIKYWIVRTMLNMAKSDRSTFYNKFRQTFTEYIDAYDRPDEVVVDDRIPVLYKAMNELHWYEGRLFNLYAEKGGNVQAVSADTSIPYRSAIKTINKVKFKLRKALRTKEESQKKMVGSYVHANLGILLDIAIDTNTDEIVDLMEEASLFIRERIEGMTKGDVTIRKVDELRINKVI